MAKFQPPTLLESGETSAPATSQPFQPPALGDWTPPALAEEKRKPTRKEQVDYFANRNPLERFLTQSMGMAKNIPVLGNFVPETEAMKKESEMGGWGVQAGRTMGGIAGTIPAAMALPMAGASVPAQMAMGSGFGAGMTLADAYTSDKPPSNDEAVVQGLFGGVTGALGPGVSRLLWPAGAKAARPIKEPTFARPKGKLKNKIDKRKKLGKEVSKVEKIPGPDGMPPELASSLGRYNQERTARMAAEEMGNKFPNLMSQGISMGIGGLLGHTMTGDLSGAAIGALAGVGGKKGFDKFAKTKVGKSWLGSKSNPTENALINSMFLNVLDKMRTPEDEENNAILNTLSGR